MAVLTRIRRWSRRWSTPVFPLYIDLTRGQFTVRCWLCQHALWADGMIGDRSRVLNLGDLADAITWHSESCKGW